MNEQAPKPHAEEIEIFEPKTEQGRAVLLKLNEQRSAFATLKRQHAAVWNALNQSLSALEERNREHEKFLAHFDVNSEEAQNIFHAKVEENTTLNEGAEKAITTLRNLEADLQIEGMVLEREIDELRKLYYQAEFNIDAVPEQPEGLRVLKAYEDCKRAILRMTAEHASVKEALRQNIEEVASRRRGYQERLLSLNMLDRAERQKFVDENRDLEEFLNARESKRLELEKELSRLEAELSAEKRTRDSIQTAYKNLEHDDFTGWTH